MKMSKFTGKSAVPIRNLSPRGSRHGPRPPRHSSTSESGDRFSFLRPQSPLGIEQVLSEYLTSPFQGTAELETANKQNFGIHLKATHVFTSANKFYR